MIIQYSENNENRIYWQHSEGEEWRTAELHELIEAYEREKTGKWIPVSERLPENRMWVLAIFQEPGGWINPIPFIADYAGRETPITTNEYWIFKEHTDETERGFEYYKSLKCVAWMPLPEPHKDGEREHTMEEFMYGQDLGSPEDGSL